MERLTSGNEGMCQGLCRGNENYCSPSCETATALDRLAAYEETGLMPEEIESLQAEVDALRKENVELSIKKLRIELNRIRKEATHGIPLSRLEAICNAERSGRCVVLPAPAKEGEAKPSCFHNDCAVVWCLGMSSENDDEPTERCKKCWYCEKDEAND